MASYMLYSVSFMLFVAMALLYFFRQHWLPLVRVPSIAYNPVPSTFRDDAASGLHSSTFDLSANIEAGDSRHGLDEAGKKEVQRIMKSRGVDFDEARRIAMMNKFAKGGIGEDGRPRDPKFVSFSN